MNKIRNNIQLTFFLLMTFVSVGCTTETKKEKLTKSAELAEQTPKLIKEDFSTFFVRFSADSVFQLSRISFPISYYLVDIEDNKEEYVYSKDDFVYIDFTLDKEAYKSTENAYKSLIENVSDIEMIYIKRGIDNGIRVEYYFKINDEGKWYMTEVIDKSN